MARAVTTPIPSSKLQTVVSAFIDGWARAKADHLPVALEALHGHKTSIIDAFEDHGKETLAPFVEQVDQLDNMPGITSALVDSIRAPRSFAGSTQIVAAVGALTYMVVSRLAEPFLQPALNEAWSTTQAMPLSAAEVALNHLRGGHFKNGGEHEASLTGINATRFGVLLENTGEPISIQEALYLMRRNKLSAGDVERAVRQSRVRDEWIPAVMDLTHGPPSSGEAIGAAVRNLLSDDQAREIVGQNGIDPAAYDWLRAAAGRPPGIQEMLSLLNRGIVDEATVIQAIRESDVKDKYIPAILASRRHLMPERTVVSAVGKHIFTPAEGVEHLLMLGFSAEDAAALVAEAGHEKTATQRDVSQSMIVDGYAIGLLDRADAAGRLVELGYDDDEAGFMLDLSDAKVIHAQHNAAVNKIRGLVIAHRVESTDAVTALVNLGVPGGLADELVRLWAAEASANVAELTIVQLGHLLKAGWITLDDYMQRLERRGYSPDDAGLLAVLATGATPPVEGQ